MQSSAKQCTTCIYHHRDFLRSAIISFTWVSCSPACCSCSGTKRRHEVAKIDFFLSLRCPLCINQSTSSATSGVVSWPWLWPGSTSWPPTCSAFTPRRRTRRSWPSCSSSSGCSASFWPVGQAGFSAWLQLWTSDHSFPVLPEKHY